MLKLRRYLYSEGIQANIFARNIGVSPSYIYKILSQGMLPNLTAAIRIEEQTRGHVSVYDWKIEPKGKKDKKSKKKTEENTQADNPEVSIVFET